jgi:Response regulator containing CheY-like receiver domain and AraC-type DNA-binding domain
VFRAIIVEDFPIIRFSIASQVDESANPVITAGTAENGERALEWLSTYNADVCITDIKMPVMDGFELIKNIKEKYPWMTSLVISSYDEFNYARTSIQLEAVDYILKPVDQGNLDQALHKAVKKIESSRSSLATAILFSRMQECYSLYNKWIEFFKIKSINSQKLIEETAIKLCELSEGKYFLMEYLTLEWINVVTCQLIGSKLESNFRIVDKSNIKTKEVLNIDLEHWFSAMCSEILINGLNEIENRLSSLKCIHKSKIVESLIIYIKENYLRSDLVLQELADYVAASKTHISSVFKQEIGVTIWSYIIDLRMKEAKKLLAETMDKSYEIALKVGYNDYIHFSRLFKEYCGISPQEYRKRTQVAWNSIEE